MMTRSMLFLSLPLVIAALSPASRAQTACQPVVNCIENDSEDCLQEGAYCCDAATGPGTCKHLTAGVCVCNPASSGPRPTPSPDDWGGTGGKSPLPSPGPDPGPGPICPDSPCTPKFDPSVGGFAGGSADAFASGESKFPQVGDIACLEQTGAAAFEHHYSAIWGSVPSETILIASSGFCVKVADKLGDGWFSLDVTNFHATMPSFNPNALPKLSTGENHMVRDVIPSRGKIYAPTGDIVLEFNLQLTNSIFNADFPANVRVGARGKLDMKSGHLEMIEMNMDSMTPPAYKGARP